MYEGIKNMEIGTEIEKKFFYFIFIFYFLFFAYFISVIGDITKKVDVICSCLNFDIRFFFERSDLKLNEN